MTDEQLAFRLGDDLISASQEDHIRAAASGDGNTFYRELGKALVKRLGEKRIAIVEKCDATRIPGFREVNALLFEKLGKVIELGSVHGTGVVTQVSLVDP